ncbi:MAG: hypothetical protein ABII06_15600 [Pseudomonadota bacterium]
MYSLYKSMALFWTLAEGLLVFFLRWGFIFFSRGRGRQRVFLLFCLGFFLFLGGLLFAGEGVVGSVVDLQRGHHLKIYRWALWNFFCTLWVVLEGLIMIYMIRIYRELRPCIALAKTPGSLEVRDRNRALFGAPLLICSLFALYVFYQFNLFSLLWGPGLDSKGIYRISVFYIRICGIFWILFEGIAAVLTVKAFLILKNMEDPIR